MKNVVIAAVVGIAGLLGAVQSVQAASCASQTVSWTSIAKCPGGVNGNRASSQGGGSIGLPSRAISLTVGNTFGTISAFASGFNAFGDPIAACKVTGTPGTQGKQTTPGTCNGGQKQALAVSFNP